MYMEYLKEVNQIQGKRTNTQLIPKESHFFNVPGIAVVYV